MSEARILRLALTALVGLLALAGVVGKADEVGRLPAAAAGEVTVRRAPPEPRTVAPTAESTAGSTAGSTVESTVGSTEEPTGSGSPTRPAGGGHATGTPLPPVPTLPRGTRTVFGHGEFLVAYYGTAGTGSLGVLGETSPDVMDQRLRAAATPFRGRGRPLQTVYELIVTVVDGRPGHDGSYSHDISRADVRRYIAAAHRHGALLLLDLQPGRTGFLEAAKRWEWALRDPWVGLALDPEWRMGPHQVPARVVGHVRAREVNATSRWLADLVARERLPEKLFVVHQFRTSMIEDIADVVRRPGLAMVQHVDGFGTPGQKRSTYAAVAYPRTFTMGFKLFYDEDVRRLGPRGVLALRPRVRFVSFQ